MRTQTIIKGRPSALNTLQDRLHLVDCKTIEEYYRSETWRNFSACYRKSTMPKLCLACKNRSFLLFHISGKSVGQESLNDVLPLCRQCELTAKRFLDKNKKLSMANFEAVLVLCFKMEAKVAKDVMRPFWKEPAPSDSAPKADRPKKGRKKRFKMDRGNWTPEDPCPFCGYNGEHKIKHSHGTAHKVTCGRCGKYMKFVNEASLIDKEFRDVVG